MFKKMSAVICLALFAFALSGCGADKGQEFLGRWTGENKTRMGKPTYVMDISKDGEIFHINLETTADIVGYGKMKKTLQRFEAKAESDSVLSMAGGFATMRLEGSAIYFDGTTYTRLK
ncbi:hypothetical protein KDX38_25395 [Pseudomonas sp. CDFA 602]|uniref:Lipoprotein n=1 Tax=Pseudomonas syringae pv. delphinii TaxID=192088 RepID=A0A3M4JIQ4_9PSED|nr:MULTISPECIES: hypothetical protein [Pseudomonas]MCD5996964.1 hypothetical protein [Pseudomonas californiensis]MCD6002521.1 hypothetical protein [Pseudomonas californiensis]RMP17913.1 hypothetical protein ALQ27_200187 [Pseudomonas syringae pv. delphinii]RMQ16545.1 hypothetical protein ALQ08_200262 [Pseudomonas syringae pv. delphinii]